MKKTLIVAFIGLISLSSCERCYQCVSQQSIQNSGVWFNGPDNGKEFCGNKKQRENYEKEHSGLDTIETNIGGVKTKAIQETKTTCN